MDKEAIDAEIARVVLFLSMLEPSSEEYTRGVQNLNILCEARTKKPASIIELETLYSGAIKLLLGILIIRHEQFNIVTSKAFGLITTK